MATKDKYDRQLRLWGPSGQRALSQSTIVLFNATAAGTETLKNLVLPGVGSFHIVDENNALVPNTSSKKPEVFSNFFVFNNEEEAENGNGEKKKKTRAEVACQHLMELNPDVKGSSQSVVSFDETDYQSLLLSISNDSNKEDTEERFGKVIVIAADLPPKPLLSLSTTCWDADISLVIVKSYGLIGSVRLQLNHHPIIQSRPDSEVPDLRLAEDKIFPSLQNLVDEVSLEKLDDKEHAHIPSVILLIKAMKLWKEKTQKTSLPKTLEEKNEYREVIKSMSRDFQDELNFEEACKDAYLAYTKKEIPFEVQALLDDISKNNVSDLFDDTSDGKKKRVDNVKFDVLIFALSKFLKENNGQPPIHGSIPDMTASTDIFIKLQEAYKTKASEDVQSMQTIIDSIVEQYRSSSSDAKADSIPKISNEDIALFCKNVFNLQLLKTRPFHEEYLSQTRFMSSSKDDANEVMETNIDEEIKDDLMMVTMDPYEQIEHTPLLWHIALRACDKFHEAHNIYPGSDGRELSLLSDVKEVQTYIKDIVGNLGLEDTDFMKETLLLSGSEEENKHAKEMVRYFNAEVHNVGSVLGGVASQEVVKIITGQYVPLNDTYIYNGIAGVAGVYRL
mmetsp:Transcript_7107/g.9624  ORF Transcript_7107/g.9624 Transcript_7107/m.9624 type:complete len:618 (-) Transcript_7107:92-1945(-)|eukprot:CAMPEP_0185737910 /NCGR_PEP_ID=MMETSP1171-20130828/31574_1 /TAXON_ID=374046 /ORGANISM="Helicotheca tamensis, Strain CCMP826" /LENGTH=617 /DNA_ID=CAMNT_0028408953 /DNA_START=57 /DNA_END=1910 /DNA_ORIENTATION=+